MGLMRTGMSLKGRLEARPHNIPVAAVEQASSLLMKRWFCDNAHQ